MAELQLNNRRERRIAARKAQILYAAAQVFSRQGYERATTREIADIADVSEGTLYNYFNSKRELLIGVAKAYADQVAEEIAQVDAEDFGEMLARAGATDPDRGEISGRWMCMVPAAPGPYCRTRRPPPAWPSWAAR